MYVPVTVDQVFRPNGFPLLTYVRRDTRDYEEELRQSLRSGGTIISLTGPSKSGKTVLAEQVIGAEHQVAVKCSHIRNVDEFWMEVFRRLDLDLQREHEHSTGHEIGASVEGEGKIKIPLLADAGARGGAQYAHQRGRVLRTLKPEIGSSTAIDEMLDRKKTLVLDDFHYLPRDLQTAIARQLKDAAYRGLSSVVLSVPHRGDDCVRAVPDLRGRVEQIALDYWKESELRRIAGIGFPQLEISLDEGSVAKLAEESLGSPQIMQRLCLDLCHVFGVRRQLSRKTDLSLDRDAANAVFKRAATTTDYSAHYKALAAGPRHGKRRDQYDFKDGTRGDVYVAVFAAIAVDPLRNSISYQELKDRVERVLRDGGKPGGQAVQRAVRVMHKMAAKMADTTNPPEEPVLQWEDGKGGVLDLPDPYFLFYIRWKKHADLTVTLQTKLELEVDSRQVGVAASTGVSVR